MAILSYRTQSVKACQGDAQQRCRVPFPLPRRHPPRLGSVAVLLLFLAAGAVPSSAPLVRAQGQSPTEYQIKAAFLYNFAKFVEWPPEAFVDANAPIYLCVSGEDPFGDSLEQTISGKTVNGRPLAIKRLKTGQDPKACQILFICSSERKRLPQILESLRGSIVLTVGEIEGFAHLGGMVNFVLEESRVRFEVNVDAAARSRLKISSKLLALAKVVPDPRRGEKE